MRSGLDPTDYLVIVAKKKPRLQALLDSLGQLTQEDILALSEPLWVKDALSRLKESNGVTQAMRVQAIVERAIAAEEAAMSLPKRTYEVRLWDQPSKFVGDTNAMGNSWTMEILTNDVCLVLGDHSIKVWDSVIGITDIQTIIRSSRMVGYMTLEQYKGFCRALVDQRHKIV
jgi:hypothetical protein